MRTHRVRVPARAAAWIAAHRVDVVLLALVLTAVAVLQARGLGRFPAFFDDEGTYVSQAWAVDRLGELAPYTYWYDHPPLGWLLLAGWSQVFSPFGEGVNAIGEARAFMVVLLVVSRGGRVPGRGRGPRRAPRRGRPEGRAGRRAGHRHRSQRPQPPGGRLADGQRLA